MGKSHKNNLIVKIIILIAKLVIYWVRESHFTIIDNCKSHLL